MKRAVPSKLLSRIVIETPCNQDWAAMQGDDRKRHCSSCKKFVHNLSEMTTEEALALLGAREPVCVRLFRRPDGTVLTKECGTVKVKRWRGYAIMSAAACALLSFIGLKNVAADNSPETAPTPAAENDKNFILGEVSMGDVAEQKEPHGLWEMMGGIRPMSPPETEEVGRPVPRAPQDHSAP